MDPRTISGYFIGYAEKSKGYSFYCPSHSIRFVESRNAKFLENDLISGSDQSRNVSSEKIHTDTQCTTTSNGLIVVVNNTPPVQMRVEEPVQEEPQTADLNPVDTEVQQMSETVEQPVDQHDSIPQDNVDAALRRSTRLRKSAIPNDYVVYLQESDYNVGAENDPETFSQAMSSKDSNLWHNAMKDEMDSMASNGV